MFYAGNKISADFGLTPTSHIAFSDFTEDMWHPENRVKFTKEALLFCYGGNEYLPEDYFWKEYDDIEVCSWDCVDSFIVINDEGETVKNISHEEIDSWRQGLDEIDFSFPKTIVDKGNCAIYLEGIPISERSKGKGKANLKEKINSIRPELKSFYKDPIDCSVKISIYVFTTQYSPKGKGRQLPDIDRISQPIIDSLKGLIFIDDNQVIEV